jgi:hypothetical protein
MLVERGMADWPADQPKGHTKVSPKPVYGLVRYGENVKVRLGGGLRNKRFERPVKQNISRTYVASQASFGQRMILNLLDIAMMIWGLSKLSP